jgi:hypothetical protein
MTVINGIEIDDVKYIHNEIKEAIINNDPIEDNLHVVIVISNPCQYARRYILAREFIKRFEKEQNVILYIVELIFDHQNFCVTENNNPKHLQLTTSSRALWHKENMINIGVQKLLPKNWKAFAWVDADIEFDSASWALDTLKILNGCRDIIQLFSHCSDMDKNEDPMRIFQGFGFQYSKQKKYSTSNGLNFWHPGFAWAITRKAYDRIGGIYEKSILGSGDHNISLSLIGQGIHSINSNVSNGYKKSITEYQKKINGLRLGYVPGFIRHYFHGSKENRKYSERWMILVEHQYDPYEHVTYDNNGLLIPSDKCPKELLDDIYKYFSERNEDEGFL